MRELIERLRERHRQTLAPDWIEGRKCPECDTDAARPKCMWDMGANCPRNDPDSYDDSPYQTVPDVICHKAADTLEAQEARIAQLEGALHRARPIVEADWHAGMEAKDADWEGMAYAALEAIDAALQKEGGPQ